MRPRFTLKNAILLLFALGVFGGLALWVSRGAPLPGAGVPDTAGKIVFVSDRASGQKDLFLMNADGSEVAQLTQGGAEDRAPAWRKNGGQIAFISTRSDNRSQVFVASARPGADAQQLTITSSAKDEPVWGSDNRVYYLASGQLTATTPGTSDADAVFPTADLRQTLGEVLSSGGLTTARPSPSGKHAAAILRLESGRALLLFEVETSSVQVLAAGEDVSAAWAADGTLVAAVRRGALAGALAPSWLPGNFPRVPPPPGARAPQDAVVLYNDAAASQATAQGVFLPPPQALPPAPRLDGSLLAHFDADGNVLEQSPLPFGPSSLAVSPDGKQAAVGVEEGDQPGLYLVPVSGGKPTRLAEQAAREPAWSPDGKSVVFVAGRDIFSLPASGGTPVNLTKGQGTNTAPAWSPATGDPPGL